MASGIDATVVLGLAGKATQVFSEPETFLSFALTPIGISSSRFHALAADPMSSEGQQALSEFSLLVNEVPEGPVWQPGGDLRLWDIYGDVLESELADASRTPEEERDYQHACALLYQTQPDGTVADSAAVAAYEQYRDAYLAASQEYNNRKGATALAADVETKEQWATEEPNLRELVAESEQDWAMLGHRFEVDEARRLLRQLGSKSPSMVWAGYLKLFDPDLPEIFFRTSPDNSMYVPTSYIPSDVVDVAWNTMTLRRDELAALAGSAPAGLRSRLEGGDDSGIETVSFEYSAVTLNRPWFAPEAFASRAWRFYESNRVLSDGAASPSGECTAYVSGLFLGRNITVRQAAGRPNIHLGFLPASRALVQTSIARRQPAAFIAMRAKARRALRAQFGSRLRAGGIATPRRPNAPLVRATPVGRRRDIRIQINKVARKKIQVVAPSQRMRSTSPIIAKNDLAASTERHPASPPSVPTTTGNSDYVYILAFICKRLPQAPNPDPALHW